MVHIKFYYIVLNLRSESAQFEVGFRRYRYACSYYGHETARSVKCVFATDMTYRIRGYRLKFKGTVKLRLFS
jgi:hypothetical protein